MEQYVGEIRMFAGKYAPQNWKICDGSLLSISEYQTLFTLIGTTYGGDGSTNFKLPDLRGRVPIHNGTGTGLHPIALGEPAGTESVTITAAHLPPHTHTVGAQSVSGTKDNPSGNLLANAQKNAYTSATSPLVSMNQAAVTEAGVGDPTVSIIQPFHAVNFIIAVNGIYPQS